MNIWTDRYQSFLTSSFVAVSTHTWDSIVKSLQACLLTSYKWSIFSCDARSNFFSLIFSNNFSCRWGKGDSRWVARCPITYTIVWWVWMTGSFCTSSQEFFFLFCATCHIWVWQLKVNIQFKSFFLLWYIFFYKRVIYIEKWVIQKSTNHVTFHATYK